MTTRIEPLASPYDPDVEQQLAEMMPPDTPPILLFRTLVKNPAMTHALQGWGSYELSRRLSLSMRDREIVIDRTTARCGCEYEWGVHVAFFAHRVDLDHDQIASLTHGDASDACWTAERERILIEVADALHDSADLSDALFARARTTFDEAQLLDLFLLCGWYHALSFAANAARTPLEPNAPRFDDYAGGRSSHTTSID